MPYDMDLADRIRELLAAEPELTEMRMFGGLAFLIGGHLTIAASGQGGVLVRVDPSTADDLVVRTTAEVVIMRGRPMAGWLHVEMEDLRTKRQLSTWVSRAERYVRTLPPKRR